jgi:hypothetical protein
MEIENNCFCDRSLIFEILKKIQNSKMPLTLADLMVFAINFLLESNEEISASIDENYLFLYLQNVINDFMKMDLV